MEDTPGMGAVTLLVLLVFGAISWHFYDIVWPRLRRWLTPSNWRERRSSYIAAVAVGTLSAALMETSDEQIGAAIIGAFVAYFGVATLTDSLVGSQHQERRSRLRRGSAILLIILGSGITTAGAVESEGAAAGLGVMLIVSGVFLLGLKKLSE